MSLSKFRVMLKDLKTIVLLDQSQVSSIQSYKVLSTLTQDENITQRSRTDLVGGSWTLSESAPSSTSSLPEIPPNNINEDDITTLDSQSHETHAENFTPKDYDLNFLSIFQSD